MPATFLLFRKYSRKIGHLFFLNYATTLGAGLDVINNCKELSCVLFTLGEFLTSDVTQSVVKDHAHITSCNSPQLG